MSPDIKKGKTITNNNKNCMPECPKSYWRRKNFFFHTLLIPTPKRQKRKKKTLQRKQQTLRLKKRDKKLEKGKGKDCLSRLIVLISLGIIPVAPPFFPFQLTTHFHFPPFFPFFADKGIRVCECVDRRHSSFILFFYCVSWVGGRKGGSCAFQSLLSSNTVHSKIYFGFLTGKKCEVKPRNFNLGDKSDTSFPPLPAKTAIKQGWKLHHFFKN